MLIAHRVIDTVQISFAKVIFCLFLMHTLRVSATTSMVEWQNEANMQNNKYLHKHIHLIYVFIHIRKQRHTTKFQKPIQLLPTQNTYITTSFTFTFAHVWCAFMTCPLLVLDKALYDFNGGIYINSLGMILFCEVTNKINITYTVLEQLILYQRVGAQVWT